MVRTIKSSVIALTLAGALLIAMGIYFVFFRPPLLPEDSAYIGSTLPTINYTVPGLSVWLKKVFLVLGGYILSTGILIAYTANTSFKNRIKGAFSLIIMSGSTSIGLMVYANFIINSNFKWLLLTFTIPWLIALILYQNYK